MTIEEIQKRVKEVAAEIGHPCTAMLSVHETFVPWYFLIVAGTRGTQCGSGDTLEEAISDAKAELAAAEVAHAG